MHESHIKLGLPARTMCFLGLHVAKKAYVSRVFKCAPQPLKLQIFIICNLQIVPAVSSLINRAGRRLSYTEALLSLSLDNNGVPLASVGILPRACVTAL